MVRREWGDEAMATGRKASKRASDAHDEATLDEMLDETFPASDPPQLEGTTGDRPSPRQARRHPAEHPPPPQVAGGDDAALDVREGRCALGEAGEAVLRTEAGMLELRMPANPVRLDAASLERLIEALEHHRPPLRR